MDTYETIAAWLGHLPTAPHSLAPDTALIEDGILDSIEILNLVAFIEERFAVVLPVDAFIPENFATPAAVAALVVTLTSAVPA